MIVKKNTTKYSVEYTLIQGDKIFQFREYTDDFGLIEKCTLMIQNQCFLKDILNFLKWENNVDYQLKIINY
jgi:hypothetical protein